MRRDVGRPRERARAASSAGSNLPVGGVRERSEVHRDGASRRPRSRCAGDGVVGSHVLLAHVPDGPESADREDREAKPRKRLADRSEVGAPTGIAGEVDRARRTRDDEAAPERAVVARRGRVPSCGAPAPPSAVTSGGDLAPSATSRARARRTIPCAPRRRRVAEARVDRGLPRRLEPRERRQVHVVVVVVADEHDVDRRQVVEAQARRPAATRADDRRRALGPRRVRQDVEAVHLDEERRVVDERRRAGGRPRRTRGGGGPGRRVGEARATGPRCDAPGAPEPVLGSPWSSGSGWWKRRPSNQAGSVQPRGGRRGRGRRESDDGERGEAPSRRRRRSMGAQSTVGGVLNYAPNRAHSRCGVRRAFEENTRMIRSIRAIPVPRGARRRGLGAVARFSLRARHARAGLGRGHREVHDRSRASATRGWPTCRPRTTVPSPTKYLGHVAGAAGELSRTSQIYGYFRELAKATPRVKVDVLGKSEEGREILLVAIADEESIRDLDAPEGARPPPSRIRARRRRSRPRRSSRRRAPDLLLQRRPPLDRDRQPRDGHGARVPAGRLERSR